MRPPFRRTASRSLPSAGTALCGSGTRLPGVLTRPLEWERKRSTTWPFSPDGKTIVTVDDGGSVRTWSGPDFRRSEEFARSPSPAVAVAISPDGRILAVGRRDSLVVLWEFASRRELSRLKAQDAERAETLAFSPDSRQLAVGAGRQLDVFELSSGHYRRLDLPDWLGGIRGVAYSRDGRFLAANSGPRVYLLDRVSDVRSAELIGHTRAIQSLAFSPDDQLLATSSDDGTVRVWDVPSGRARAVLSPGVWTVWCVAFSPDGTELLATYSDGAVRRWSLKRLQDYRLTESAALSWASDKPPVFSPRDGRVAIVLPREQIRLFSPDLSAARDVYVGHGVYSRLAFTADGRRLTSVALDGSVAVAAVDQGMRLTWLRINPAELNLGRSDYCCSAARPGTGSLLLWSKLNDGLGELHRVAQ